MSAAHAGEPATTPDAVARATIAEALAPIVAARGATLAVDVPPNAGRLDGCAHMAGFVPPGARLVGRTTVGVRCLDGPARQAYVAATVKLEAPVWQATHALRAGETVAAADVVSTTASLAAADVDASARGLASLDARRTNPVGRVLARSVVPGRALVEADLKDTGRIVPGDPVRVVYRGNGFAVSAEARAVGAADPGGTLLVRLASGTTVSGTLRDDRRVELPH